jgi:hypothetical protein
MELKVYNNGPAFLMTNDLPAKLYAASFVTRDFWIADVYDGICAAKISNVTFVSWWSLYMWYSFFEKEVHQLTWRLFVLYMDPKNTSSYERVFEHVRKLT